jgi:aspartate/methionine/tyrosine aminotransferase
MKFPPFLLEDWLIRCQGAKIDLDHSGAPSPYGEGFDPCIGGEAWLNELDLEEKLIKALAKAYKVKEDRVAVTTGAQNANFTFLLSCFDRRDRVAAEVPSYSPIRACEEALFKRVLDVPRPRQDGFKVDMRALRKAFQDGAEGATFTNLHNPSAQMLGKEEVKEILEVAGKKDARVLFDEIYREMSYSEPPPGAYALGDNGVSTSGLSKLWGLGGLRVGWLIGPEEVAQQVQIARSYATHHLSSRSMAVAIKAVQKREWFRKRVLKIAKHNLPAILDWAEGEKRVQITEPQGCMHFLVHLPEGMDDERFSEMVFKRFKTAICPGRYFGAEGSVRVTFTGSREDLEQGLRHISKTLDAFL